MVQKSGVYQLRLVVYFIIYRVLAPSQVVVNGISEPSTVPICFWAEQRTKNLAPLDPKTMKNVGFKP